jgi:hypothetical protein
VVIPDRITKAYGWISTVTQIILNLGSRQLHTDDILPPEKGTLYPLNGRHFGRYFQLSAVENRKKTLAPAGNGTWIARFSSLQSSHWIAVMIWMKCVGLLLPSVFISESILCLEYCQYFVAILLIPARQILIEFPEYSPRALPSVYCIYHEKLPLKSAVCDASFFEQRNT